MLRAIAKQAEAERWRRARVIEAEGERQASKVLAEAASQYETHPVAIRLRELQTLTEIAKERALIIVTDATRGMSAEALATSVGTVKHLLRTGEGEK